MNHDSYPDDLHPRHPQRREDDRAGRRSANPARPSYIVVKYLQRARLRVIPVNPGLAGKEILGRKVYRRLADIPEPIDMVEIFRNSEAAGPITDEALALDPLPKVIWMQLAVRNDEAAARAEAGGVKVIMNRCPKIEFGRLSGEIGWQGVNSRILSSKKPVMRDKGIQKLQHRQRTGREPVRDEARSRSASSFALTPARRSIKRTSYPVPRTLAVADSDQRSRHDRTEAPGFATLAIHAGAQPDPATGARATPIYQTTSFVFDDVDHAASLFGLQAFGNIYSRIGNPTSAVLEERVAALEGGTAALAVASGHAARVPGVPRAACSPATNSSPSKKLYGGSINQFNHAYKNFDWRVKWADPDDLSTFEAAISPTRPRRSSSNPSPIPAASSSTSRRSPTSPTRRGVPLIVDNTMATPYLIRPFEHGADIIVHSATKFLGGHGNSIGGADRRRRHVRLR